MKRLNDQEDFVSIIIPTFNRYEYLGETLDSIINQTHLNWECLIIDDNSSDYTAELVDFYNQKDSRVIFWKRPITRPKGANSCRNFGFKKSQGDYINWFDSDDIMLPSKLEEQLKLLKDSKFDFCVCQVLFFENTISKISRIKRDKLKSKNPFEDFIQFKIYFMTPAPLFSKSYLEKQSYLFNEKLQAAQEYEFFARLLFRNPSYKILNLPLVLARNHTENISNSKNRKEVLWNYYQARLMLLSNKDFKLSRTSKYYLTKYLIDCFKEMVINRYFYYALKTLFNFIIITNTISNISKFKAILALLSYSIKNKGYKLLSAVQPSKDFKN